MFARTTSRIALYGIAAVLVSISCAQIAAADILVYDQSSEHHFAATAAANIDPAAVIANAGSFNALLASQSWDAVLIDCPSTQPTGGWQPTIDFIGNGGKVAMSFWDWDNNSGAGHPDLVSAFGSSGIAETVSLDGRTLVDAGTTAVFDGVSMPNSDWHDHWADDGDAFGFALASGTIGMASLSGIADPIMVLGNGGRTIAAFIIDEAGNTWLNNGSGVRLWENMYYSLVPEPNSSSLLIIAGFALLTRRRTGNASAN